MGEVGRRQRGEGVLSPMGGGWPRSTIRYLLLKEAYWPRRPKELEGLLPAALLARLDPEREYGLWTWNTVKTKRWRERSEDGEYRNRVKNEGRPREAWSSVAVDLSGSGLDRAHVDAAREQMAQNGRRRPPSTQARRFWLLSGGIARCEVCGNAYSPHTVHQRGKVRRYYRCYTRYNYGLEACTNGRSTPAAPLEKAAWEAVRSVCEHPERVLVAYEQHLERRRRALAKPAGPGGAGEARTLHERLRKLDSRRAGYQDLAADGDITREDLRARLAEIDGQREGVRRALEEARSREETAQRLRSERELVYRSFAAMRSIDLRHLESEDRRRVMQALRISAEVDPNSDVRITGVLGADITELLPMSQAPAGEPYVVRFRREVPPPTPPHRGVVTLDSTPP
jgi:DNA-binding FrmR family transcriptional regulator